MSGVRHDCAMHLHINGVCQGCGEDSYCGELIKELMMARVVGRITGAQRAYRNGQDGYEFVDQDGTVLTWLQLQAALRCFGPDGYTLTVGSINGVPVHNFTVPESGLEWTSMVKQDSTRIRRFTAYRRDMSTRETHNDLQKNADDMPQFEGVIFTDGTVVLRWLTAVRATSVWASLKDALAIHGHPEYGTEIVWHDDPAAPIEWLEQVDSAKRTALAGV